MNHGAGHGHDSVQVRYGASQEDDYEASYCCGMDNDDCDDIYGSAGSDHSACDFYGDGGLEEDLANAESANSASQNYEGEELHSQDKASSGQFHFSSTGKLSAANMENQFHVELTEENGNAGNKTAAKSSVKLAAVFRSPPAPTAVGAANAEMPNKGISMVAESQQKDPRRAKKRKKNKKEPRPAVISPAEQDAVQVHEA